MVTTRSGRRSYASDEDVRPPGSLPGGPTPVHQRVSELRETISRLATPRLPAPRVFAMLSADHPARRGSWEGLMTPAKPAGVTFEGDGTLASADSLPPPAETVEPTFAATPRISPLAQGSVPPSASVDQSVKDFEFTLEADQSTGSAADASFRTADPESAPATPVKPAQPQRPERQHSSGGRVTDAAGDGGRDKRVSASAPVTPATAGDERTPRSAHSAPPPATQTLPVGGQSFPDPTVKFRAPASGDASAGIWKTVGEGTVIDTDGWVTSVKKSAPVKSTSDAVKLPAVTGPQQFPDWYLQ